MNVARFWPADLNRELERWVDSLVGQACEGFRVRTATFGLIQLRFSRHKLSFDCSWRLDSEAAVLCGVGNSQRKGGLVQRGLSQLVGERVTGVRFDKPGNDLALVFSNGYTLSVFCSHVNVADMLDNYSLEAEDGSLVVGTSGFVRVEEG